MFNTKSRRVFFAIVRRVATMDLDGETSTPRRLAGVVEVEGVELSGCGSTADIYFVDGSVAFDVSMTGAMLH